MSSVNVRGATLNLHPRGDYVSDHIRKRRDYYEANILDTIQPFIRPGVIVDAGAHIGNHTVYFATHVGAVTIHAFEPWPESYALLRQNTAPYDNVLLHQMALSDHNGPVIMGRADGNYGHSAVDAPYGMVWEEVQARALDDLGLEDVTFMKVDVEEYEPILLAGAHQTIERWRPLMLIEDWAGSIHEHLPGYRMLQAWPTQQTYLYGP